MPRFKIEFFEKENGEQPAKIFMLGLTPKLRAKLSSMIALLADNGYELREPYSKSLSDGIFELRVKHTSNVMRVLYFFYYDNHIVLTNGFIKTTRKTPKAQLMKAKEYRKQYIASKESKADEQQV